ncbi:MAG: hypothetical protein H7X99_09450 [Saprospiraceae bacterium]|nr:hypothetical protein [Saprospiraceae bacterium]
MKIKISVIFCLILFNTIQLFCQTTEKYVDKIYLKNGSVLQGKVLYYNPLDSVIFTMEGGEPVTFPSNMVKKIKMSTAGGSDQLYSFRENTLYTRSQISILYQKDNNGISLSQSVGYQYKYWLALGAGIGIDNYVTDQGNNLFPVFMEVRSYLQKQNISPYLAFRTGYSFAFADEESGQTQVKGSYFINPVIGYKLSAGRPYLDVFFGAKFQQASYLSSDSWGKSSTEIHYRRYDMGIALTF